MGRLEQLAAMVPPCGTVADIGCDHGMLAKLLLRTGKAKRVIATDVSAPSLEKARRLAEREGLAIECRCGDGLTVLRTGEAEFAVIAGMGGRGILSILSDPRRTDGITRFLLSPHTAQRELREGLAALGLCIGRERILYDGGKYYDAMCVCRGVRALDETEAEFGCIADEADPIAEAWLTELLARTEQNITRHGAVSALLRKRELLGQALARLAANHKENVS